MLKFSANISMLFNEVPLLQRIALAKKAGFSGIEIQFPYGCDPYELKDTLDEFDIPLVLFNLPAGDMMTGGQGNAAVPGRENEFADALDIAYHYASILKPLTINILSGKPHPEFGGAKCMAVFESNLRKSFSRFAATKIQLVTEAINTFDVPNFLLFNCEQVIALIDRLSPLPLLFQYDIYHIQMMGENLEQTIREFYPKIGHIQFADSPGRAEPGSGNIKFDKLFALIDSLQYKGFVGAEYKPSGSTEMSLSWLR